jgi:hypothetical protein
MNPEQIVNEIETLHREAILLWKTQPIVADKTEFFNLVLQNHAFNFQLWHEEDKARREDKGFEFVYNAKRQIDHFNQQRNNYMELMDQWLQQQLNLYSAAVLDCPVHSETPGMIIDRLSILSLKLYHMGLQTTRQNVDEAHRLLCLEKLKLIERQKNQLLICLRELLQDCGDGKRTFKLYLQLKMYNDKNLNPELYS